MRQVIHGRHDLAFASDVPAGADGTKLVTGR
jgi:hypothetical protein